MPEPEIILDKDGGIARLELKSPPRNEIDRSFFEAFSHLVSEVLPRLDIRGLIVCGQGRHFSSGTNITELKTELQHQRDDLNKAMLIKATSDFYALEHFPFPVVAAVRGCCLGSAVELALACHYRIAATNAVFSLPEITFDLMPGCGATVRLGELVTPGKAIEMILSGQSVSAAEAMEIGLVDAVVPKHELIQSAERLINKLNPPSGGNQL